MSEGKKNGIENVKIDLPVDDNLMDLIDELTGDDEDVIDLEDAADPLSPQDSDADIIDLADESLDEDDFIDLVDESEDEILDLEEPAVEPESSEDSLALLTEEEGVDSGADFIDLVEETEDEILDLEEAVAEPESSDDSLILLTEEEDGVSDADLIDLVQEAEDEILDLEEPAAEPASSDDSLVLLTEEKDGESNVDFIDLADESEDEILDLEEPATDPEPFDDSLALLIEEETGEEDVDLMDMMGGMEDDMPGWMESSDALEEEGLDLDDAIALGESLPIEAGAGEVDGHMQSVGPGLETGAEEGFDGARALEEGSLAGAWDASVSVSLETEDPDVGAEPVAADESGVPGGHLTEAQIDAALERVIRKMFGERIDAMLTTLVDQTIIGELKALQEKLAKS